MKQGIKKFTWVVIVVMIGLLSLTTITTASDIVWPWSSEPGDEPQALSEPGNAGIRLDEGGTDVGELSVLEGKVEASTAGEGTA